MSAESVRELIVGFRNKRLCSRQWKTEAQGHKDPSDHVIIAHAMTEHLPLISSDTRFGFYCGQGLDLIFNKK